MFETEWECWLSAAHRIPGHAGLCRHLHGHDWRVRVRFAGNVLDETGELLGFGLVRDVARSVVGELQHADLNQLPGFQAENPTAENIARHIHRSIVRNLPVDSGTRVADVRVWETPKYSATYFE